VKELRAFAKPMLQPGESRTLRFSLSVRDLSYYDIHLRDFIATPGLYRVDVGSSSADIRARGHFRWAAPPDPRLPID
jgi:beta-glucosidase